MSVISAGLVKRILLASIPMVFLFVSAPAAQAQNKVLRVGTLKLIRAT
jgi:hypothetical protein